MTDTSLESVNWVTRRALICRLSKSESNRFMVEKMHVRGLVVVVEVQATTAIVDMVIVESTAIVEQKPLTTQFYLLLVKSLL